MSDVAERAETAGARPVPRTASHWSPLPAWVPGAILLAMLAGYALLFGWLSLGRYWAYEMHALDMGNMAQAAWNTIHGHPFRFTNMRLPYNIEAWNTTTRLSFHVEALFPAISLVYLLSPRPESLLILQTLAIALGAVPVYLLARDALTNRWLALVFGLAYLLYPSLEAMNVYEFHPVALATPLLLFAFLFAWRRRYGPFVLCCLAAMGTKEQIGLIVAMFGLYVAVVNRDRKIGLSVAAAGVIWSLVAVFVVEHHYRQPGTLTYVQTRYGYLCGRPDAAGRVHCHGLRGPLHTVLHDPGAIARVVFARPKLAFLVRLLAPLGFVALLAPLSLLLGAPTLLLDIFSSDFHMYSALGDNSAELIAVVVIASILGARVALRPLRGRIDDRLLAGLLAVYLLIAATWSQRAWGFTPLGDSFQAPAVGAHQKLAGRFVAMVPPSVPVATQDQLDPHLASRRYLYLFRDLGDGLAPARFVLLDVSAPTYPLGSPELHDIAAQLLKGGGWGVVAAQDGLILLRKGAGSRTIPPAFYTYAYADGSRVPHRLHVRSAGLRLLGYDVVHTDLPNHPVPNLAYRFYLRPTRSLHRDIQPVVYEVLDKTLVGCAHQPLGLAWLPTSRWSPRHTYVVRMDSLETNWQTPGRAALYVELRPVPPANQKAPDCRVLWSEHGALWPVGSLSIAF